MRLDDLRGRHREEAMQRGINPRDVDLLLGDLLGKPLTWLLAHGEKDVEEAEALGALLDRRYSGEPLQYIRRRTEFYSRDFFVDNRVLIPRPETELVVEAALERAPRGGSVVDIGTGSGCIAISIERERSDLRVLGVDRSIEALAVAAENRIRLDSRIGLAASDLLSGVAGPIDVIVSNPPYVPQAEYDELAIEVRIHEPRIALTPGPRGTEIIERMLDEGRERLAPGGWMIVEVGYGQKESVRALARERRFTIDELLPDLVGIPRVVVLSAHG